MQIPLVFKIFFLFIGIMFLINTSEQAFAIEMNSPEGIAVDSAGNIYVADSGNDRIQKFDSSGKYLLTIGSHGSGDGQFNNPQGVAVDSSSNIYVADTLNQRIQKFDSSGKYLLAESLSEFNSPISNTPEFPFSIPILLIGVISIVVFYRIKFLKMDAINKSYYDFYYSSGLDFPYSR